MTSLRKNANDPNWQTVNKWSIKGPLIGVGALLWLFGDRIHLGNALSASMVAISVPVLGFRAFWREWRFWTATALLLLVNVPVILALGGTLESWNAFGTLAFAVVYGLFALVVLSRVCDGISRNREH